MTVVVFMSSLCIVGRVAQVCWPKDNLVESVLLFHLHVYYRAPTQVDRLVWQTPTLTELSHWALNSYLYLST